MRAIKQKRINHSSTVINALLFVRPFAFHSKQGTRHCTRQLSRLVRYPRMINDLGRTTLFQRLGNGAYEFDIRSKRYLGRGAYALSVQAIGVVRHDNATAKTAVYGRVRLGIVYTLILSLMTGCTLLSYSLAAITILFLPLSLLMSAIVALHWWYLLHDRANLLCALESCLQDKDECQ